ncbi:gamma-glutamyl-gamma-aminobutyrate hydrolase family protein [Rhodococcus koreensis]
MMRPLIGIASMRSPRVDGLRFSGFTASANVVEAVFRAGGDPVILPPVTSSQQHALHHFSAIVLPGGRDMDPARYHADAGVSDPDHGPYDEVHDAVDLQLARDCIEAKVPTLAICRGLQILNVALGGDLVLDLPESAVPHRSGFHDVKLEEGCAVAHAMGTTTPRVSTYHHQAISRLGQGLRVTGRTDDGCIEAVEHEWAPVLAVQWHPEDDAADNPLEQALFNTLVEPHSWLSSIGATI